MHVSCNDLYSPRAKITGKVKPVLCSQIIFDYHLPILDFLVELFCRVRLDWSHRSIRQYSTVKQYLELYYVSVGRAF